MTAARDAILNKKKKLPNKSELNNQRMDNGSKDDETKKELINDESKSESLKSNHLVDHDQ